MNSSERFQIASTDIDLLPIVNERDEEIGNMPRRLVHLKKLRHRAVQICVIDQQDLIWLQLRSRNKDSYPLHWDFGATGHVDPGESYDQAAHRELLEELGIEAQPTFVLKVDASECTGWEFQSIYWLRWNGDLTHFDPNEVEQIRGFTLAEIKQATDDPSTPWPLTPCVPAHLPYILREAGLDPAGGR